MVAGVSSKGVLLLTNDPEAVRAVGTAVGRAAGFELGSTCGSLQELITRLGTSRAPAAVVDIDPNPERMLSLLDPVISRFPDTRFVVMSGQPRQELLLQAMQIGARHFVAKASMSVDLVGVLQRVVPNGVARRARLGFLASVLSSSGGCGATVFSVNLANELRQGSGSPTLLVDMDAHCPAVSGYLGIEPRFGLDHVLADGDRIDGELIRSAAAVHSESLFVLDTPSASTTRSHVGFTYLPKFLGACREEFDYTVIDGPRQSLDVNLELATAASMTIVPFQLTVAGIRGAKALIAALVKHGCSADQVLPVVSRYRKSRVMVSIEEAQKAMDRAWIPRLDSDFKAAVESVNFGRPLSQSAPRSSLRQGIREVALHIQKAHSQGTRAVGPW